MSEHRLSKATVSGLLSRPFPKALPPLPLVLCSSSCRECALRLTGAWQQFRESTTSATSHRRSLPFPPLTPAQLVARVLVLRLQYLLVGECPPTQAREHEQETVCKRRARHNRPSIIRQASLSRSQVYPSTWRCPRPSCPWSPFPTNYRFPQNLASRE